MITVAVADDQGLVRAGFRSLLGFESDLEVVGEAADGEEAVALVERLQPDVMLMDIRMPRLDGLAATRAVVASGARTRVPVLTTFDLDEYVFEALRSGASGFLLKDAPAEELAAAIRVVAGGNALLAPSVTRRVVNAFVQRAPASARRTDPRLASLTARELEVLGLLAPGPVRRRHLSAPVRLGGHHQDAREQRAGQARAARPGAGRGVRLRAGRRRPGRGALSLGRTAGTEIGRATDPGPVVRRIRAEARPDEGGTSAGQRRTDLSRSPP